MGVFGYIPVVNFLAPFFMVDTKYQMIKYGSDELIYYHVGIIEIDNNKIDIYRNNRGFTKNAGDLIYLYADNVKSIHAFKTNTGLVPKISSFYNCH